MKKRDSFSYKYYSGTQKYLRKTSLSFRMISCEVLNISLTVNTSLRYEWQPGTRESESWTVGEGEGARDRKSEKYV